MVNTAKIVADLCASDGFRYLEARRGMDYHRRRPQSVMHTSPREEAVESDGNIWQFKMFSPQGETEADADLVHRIVVDAMDALLAAMQGVRRAMPDAIRGEGINYVADIVMGDPD